MNNVPQEGRYARITAVLGAVALLVAYLAWQYPKSPRPDSKNPEPATATAATHYTDLVSPSGDPDLVSDVDENHAPSCGSVETAVLKPGVSTRVASGLVTLSVNPAQMGSEKFLTLGISSDRESRAEAVIGSPHRFSLKTSRGTYTLNVTQTDFAVNTMTVEVGCEPRGETR